MRWVWLDTSTNLTHTAECMAPHRHTLLIILASNATGVKTKDGANNMPTYTSNNNASFPKKPRIDKGYYPAKLVECKPLMKKDGTRVTSQYKGDVSATKLLLLFEVYDRKTKQPVLSADGVVRLPRIINDTYTKADGTTSTAFTKDSRATNDFKALGWEGPPAALNTDAFLGKWCELNVNDYDVEDAAGNYKASGIELEGVKKLEGWEPPQESGTPSPSPSSPAPVVEDVVQQYQHLVRPPPVSDAHVFAIDGIAVTETGFQKYAELVKAHEQKILSVDGLALAKKAIIAETRLQK